MMARRASSRPALSASFADGARSGGYLLRDARQAVARYWTELRTPSLLRGCVLYRRPWLLVLGPSGSGKSGFLDGAGMRFAVQYPSAGERTPVRAGERVRWLFGDNSVWIDTPGALLESAAADEWQGMAAALRKVRPRRPVDGAVVVLDARALRAADEKQVREIADTMRARLDQLMAAWGMEFPVALVLTHLDTMDGFAQFFRTLPAAARTDALGVSFTQQQQRGPARAAVAAEFALIADRVAQVVTTAMAGAKSEADRRAVCRFLVLFESMQEKLGALASELFRRSEYVGRPLFHGFYFSGLNDAERGVPAPQAPVSSTVADHPLNPRRVVDTRTPGPGSAVQPAVFALASMRVLERMRRGVVRSTTRRARRNATVAVAAHAAAVVVTVVGCWLLLVAHGDERRLLTAVSNDIRNAGAGQRVEQRYARLGALVRSLEALERVERVPRLAGVVRRERTSGAVCSALCSLLPRTVFAPAVANMEHVMGEIACAPGELSPGAYDSLYALLRVYLSLAEGTAERGIRLDSTAASRCLAEAASNTLCALIGAERLPPRVEEAVRGGAARCVSYVTRGGIQPLQADRELVRAARVRLARLPGSSSLYRTVVSSLCAQAPRMGVNELTGEDEQGVVFADNSVSEVYTPGRFRAQVMPSLVAASRSRRSVDWVVGEIETGSETDSAGLLSRMSTAYAGEFVEQWLGFLSGVEVRVGQGMSGCARSLRAVATAGGPHGRLLQRVAEFTSFAETAALGAAADAVADRAAGTLAAVPGAREVVDNAQSAARAPRGPLAAVQVAFAPLVAFVSATETAAFSLAGYRGRVAAVAQCMERLEGAGGPEVLAAFGGAAGDPLLEAWRYARAGLSLMPEGTAAALDGVLLGPLRVAGQTVAGAVGEAINGQWQAEVVRPFATGLAQRFPLRHTPQECSWRDFCDFFRPSGVFWGFYERVLSPYVVANGGTWGVRTPGAVRLEFDPALAAALDAAQGIRDGMFAPSGEPRSLEFRIRSVSGGRAVCLEVAGQRVELRPGGATQSIRWPVVSHTDGAALRAPLADGDTAQVACAGPWGFLRLLQAASLRRLTEQSMTATWRFSVQNIYQVEHACRIEVSGMMNPAERALFEAFDCPARVVVLK